MELEMISMNMNLAANATLKFGPSQRTLKYFFKVRYESRPTLFYIMTFNEL